jgi:hypothetical protein
LFNSIIACLDLDIVLANFFAIERSQSFQNSTIKLKNVLFIYESDGRLPIFAAISVFSTNISYMLITWSIFIDPT